MTTGTQPTKDKVLLIDADSIVFGAGFATEKMYYLLNWDFDEEQGIFVSTKNFQYKKEVDEFIAENGMEEGTYEISKSRKAEPLVNALALAKRTLNNIQEKLQSYNIEVYLTGDGNFRYDIATIQPYKGNRVNAARPTHEKDIRQYLIDRWDAEVVNGQEADDMVSIRQMQLWPDSVIVSADKDLDMCPGWHSKIKEPTPYYITWEQGMYNFYMQLLTGDPTDHIRGVPGVGKKKAEAILEGLDNEIDMYRAAYDTYLGYHKLCLEKEGLEIDEETIYEKVEDEVIENARLLWMKQGHDDVWGPPEIHDDT